MGGGYTTYNAGKTWRIFSLCNKINFYVFDPLDSNTFYTNAIGLFKSADKGNNPSLLYPDPSAVTRIISR
jgi:hypothetical protein